MKCIEDEIPFEVPAGWEWGRMQNITCKIGAGSTPTGGNSVYSQSGIKFIRSQNVYEDGLILNDIAYISEEINKKKNGSIVKPMDILLNITGGSIGRCALVPDTFDIGNVNQHVLIVRLVDLQLCHFIHLFITSAYVQKQILKRQVGSGHGGLSATTFSTFLIPIPPLSEQNQIKCKAHDIFEMIKSITNDKESLLGLIERAKSKVIDLAIQGKLVPQNPDDEPASVLLERIRAEKEELIKAGKIKQDKKESIIYRGEDNSYYLTGDKEPVNLPFTIPSSWEWSTLHEVCNYGTNTCVSSENIKNNDWILDLEDIEKDTGKIIKKETNGTRKTSSTKHKFSAGMVLYSKLRPYLNKVVVANADGFCTSEILPLKFHSSIIPEYAQVYLLSPFFINYANKCSYGMKMPRLGTRDGQRAIIPIPPQEEQQRIVNTIWDFRKQLNCLVENL